MVGCRIDECYDSVSKSFRASFQVGPNSGIHRSKVRVGVSGRVSGLVRLSMDEGV